MEPISLNKMSKRETEAYKASIEIDRILHQEVEGNYRSWQFEEYSVNAASLKTTYDELFILWNEEGRFRPGFNIQEGSVNISNIFAKISGTHKELDRYFKELDLFTKDKVRTILIPNVPFILNKKTIISNQSILNQDGFIELDQIKGLNNYPLAHLKTSSQNLILSKVNELLQRKDLFNFQMTDEARLKVINTILNLEDSYLKLIQNFDYPFQAPKVVLWDNNKNCLSQEDAIVLAFLHLIGFDIVLFTPTGYNNLEKYIGESYFHTHKLEEVQYDLQLQKKGSPVVDKQKRKRVTAGLLGIFLGGFGGHKFYLGRPIQGAIMLLFWWTLIPSIVGIVQGIGYLKESDESFYGQVKTGGKRVTAGLLAIFFGGFGIHKFYLGKVLQGLLHFAFSFTLIPFIIGIMEGLKYLQATDQEFYIQHR